MASIRSSLLKLANEICRKHGKAQNQKIAVSVFLETGMWVDQVSAWKWLATEYARRNGIPVELPVRRKRGRLDVPSKAKRHKPGKVRHVRERKYSFNPIPSSEFYASPAWRALRFAVLKASNGACTLCGRTHREHGVVIHVDHIKPRSKFPALELDPHNLQLLCEDCNMGKSNRDDTDWRAATDLDKKLDATNWREF